MQTRKLRIIFLCSIIILLLGWLPKLNVEEVPWYQNNDFAHYYITGDLVRKGINPYRVDIRPLYSEYGFAPDRMISKATNPPPLGWVTSWLTYFAPEAGFYLWSGVQLTALILGILLSIQVAGLNISRLESLVLILAGIAPLSYFSHLRFAQSQALMMFLIMASLFLITKGGVFRRHLGAFGMGVACSLKLFTLPIIVPISMHLGLRSVIWFILGFVSLWIPFLLGIGWAGVEDFISISIPYVSSVAHNFTGNISIVGSFINSARVISGLNDIRDLIPALNLASIAILGLSSIYVCFRLGRGASLAASVFFTLGLCCLFSPVCWNHYLLLLIPGMIYLSKSALRQDSTGRDGVLIILTYLLLGSSVGLMPDGDSLSKLVSAWSGVLGMTFYLILLKKSFSSVQELESSKP